MKRKNLCFFRGFPCIFLKQELEGRGSCECVRPVRGPHHTSVKFTQAWVPIVWLFCRRSARAPRMKAVGGTVANEGIFDN